MNPPSQRQGKVWTVLCGLVLLMTITADYAVSRGASTEALPIPVPVPIPATVFHTDNYGNSMAMAGDTLVVGAPWTDVDGADQQGVVYIFTRSMGDSTTFTLLKSITGSDSAQGDAFGWSVGIQGDTLVIGTGSVGNVDYQGAAYVFQRNQGGENNWGEVKKLVRGDEKSLTYFGRTLAIHGDTIAVGAPLGLGQVLLYQRNQDGENQWGKTQTLDGGIPITTTPRSASFGHAIAFDGTRLAISAPKVGLKAEDVPPGSPTPARNFEGATYLYHQENGQWVLDAKLFSSDLDLNNLDPVSVFSGIVSTLALNGDLLFVGAPFGKTNGVSAGKVFVYQRGAGALSPFGQPGEWGEIAQLSPLDGVEDDHFGQALYAVDDGLFVGSEKQGVGKVYFYRNPAGLVSSHETAPQAPLAWSEVYSFSTSLNGSSTEFGNPITGSDNTVVIGDHAANEGRGGSSAYPKDALFAADPNATPSPTPTATATPPPPTSDPCVVADLINPVYLPIVAGGSNAGNGAALSSAAQPLGEAPPFVGALGPDCMVTGPGGVKLGAVSGAITETLTISIAITVAPSETFPVSVTSHGNYFALSSDHNQLVTMENPFVISLPVPAGADTAHLALAYLAKAETVLDIEGSEPAWEFLDGVYDATSASFMTTLSFLTADDTSLVLVEHPDFASPANGAQIRAAGTIVGAFTVSCEFFGGSGCTPATEAVVAGYLNDIYHHMTNDSGFDFKNPRLRRSISGIIVDEDSMSIALAEGYSARIAPQSTYFYCHNAAGYYRSSSGTLTLCFDPVTGINNKTVETLTHEYFHATQYAYQKVLDHETAGREAAWVIEGMATAAEQSYFESTTMLRDLSWPLHDIDLALSTGIWGDLLYEEYHAQDFWVYIGQRENSGLDYLKSILEEGGSSTAGVATALKTKFGISFAELYWGWVKNQTIENQYSLGDGLGELCKLNNDALTTGTPVEFPASEQFYPFNTASAYDTLPPLTAKVIEMTFDAKTSALVMIEYQGCAGLQDPVAKASCVAAAQQTLKTKIYVEEEAHCQDENLHGSRVLVGLSPSKRYFVVVANADPDNDHGYFIAIE